MPAKNPNLSDGITLPGADLALAWRNAALATGDDRHDPRYYGTMVVEVHRGGLQLVASNRMIVFGTFARFGELSPVPTLDESPLDALLVSDLDGRGAALIKHIAKEAKAAAAEDRDYDVDLSLGTMDDDRRPSLDGLDQPALVIEIPGETLRLRVVGMEPIPWRSAFGTTGKAVKEFPVSPGLFKKFGQVVGYTGSLTLRFRKDGALEFEGADSACHLFGAVVAAGKPIEG